MSILSVDILDMNNNFPNHNLGVIQVNESQPNTLPVQIPERSNTEIKEILETPRTKQYVTIPNSVKQVEAALQQVLGQSMTASEFSALLVKYNAIVSGSFMLYALGLIRKLNDIDIYVNCKHLQAFRTELLERLPSSFKREFVASTYCVSFLRKNGIRSVQTIHTRLRQQFDIMGVRNKRKPTDVVQNFDLTFCQVWYDGRMVYATHPAHVFAKVGYLQKEYIPTYLQGNKFLQKRIEKYTKRGFTVTLDPKGLQDHLFALENNKYLCTKPDSQLKIKLDGKNISVANDWAFRAILEFMMTGTYTIKTFSPNSKTITYPEVVSTYISEINPYIDGYDSEDYDPPNKDELVTVAKEKATTIDPTLVNNTPEECFYHITSRLVENMMSNSSSSIKNPYIQTLLGIETHEQLNQDIMEYVKNITNLDNPRALIYNWMPYVRALQKFAKREGEDFAAEEGQLYDFHNHPLDAGITKDTLEGYIREKLESRAIKKTNQIPCFWQHSGCTQQLTLDQLRPIISDELRHTLEEIENESPNPSIFNSVVTRGKNILQNTQTATNTWGEIYHQSICPFCMVAVDRNSGCAYMNHGTSTLIPGTNIYTPGCQESELVQEIRDKYVAAINTLQENGTLVLYDQNYGFHFEFCVECGRPCVNHQHFTIFTNGEQPGIEPPRVVNTGGITDYGKCDGGGRTEMFARVLAIRKVLRTYFGADKKEQRRRAALAADSAPSNTIFMTQAATIFTQNPENREWGNVEPVNNYNENGSTNNRNANLSNIASDGSNNTSVHTYNQNLSENEPAVQVVEFVQDNMDQLQEEMDKYYDLLLNIRLDLDDGLHTREYYLEKLDQYDYEIDGILNGYIHIPNLTEEHQSIIQEYQHSLEADISDLRAKVDEQFPAAPAIAAANQQGGRRRYKKYTYKRLGDTKTTKQTKYRHSTYKIKRTK